MAMPRSGAEGILKSGIEIRESVISEKTRSEIFRLEMPDDQFSGFPISGFPILHFLVRTRQHPQQYPDHIQRRANIKKRLRPARPREQIRKRQCHERGAEIARHVHRAGYLASVLATDIDAE